MRGTQSVTWTSEDEQTEVEASIEGVFQESDYGVEGSPTLLELTECSTKWPISINCEDVPRHVMVARVGEDQTKELEESLCGLVNDDAWDMEEPDEPDRD